MTFEDKKLAPKVERVGLLSPEDVTVGLSPTFRAKAELAAA
jgi:hypothetical protein